MSEMLRRASDRTHANPLSSDSQPVRSASHQLRIDAKSIARSACREAMSRRGLTQEAMAIDADVPESTLSDAMKVDGRRNLEIGWILAQKDTEFVALFLDLVSKKLGLGPRSRRPLTAPEVTAIVSRIIEEIAS